MVTIARCGDLQEAELLKMKLEACGVKAFIPDEYSAVVNPPVFLTPSGVRVQVDESDVDTAKEILRDQV